jgi:hypothetical protein
LIETIRKAMNTPSRILCLFGLTASLSLTAGAASSEFAQPDWAVGPFTRPADAQPIIKPDTNSIFNCPMRKAPVHWEATHTFNPAAIVKDGKVYILYRAELLVDFPNTHLS